MKSLETNLTELEKIVQTKSGQQRLFEDGEYLEWFRLLLNLAVTNYLLALRQKLLAEGAASSATASAGAG